MSYKILLTSLYEADKDSPVRYYYVREGSRNYFCDAFLTVEASTKFVLSRYDIDEIVTIGRKLTFDEGDDGRQIELREGKSFYTSDIRDLSTYSLFRYRIAQYIDELRIEQQDMMESLSHEDQLKAKNYIDSFYKSGEYSGRFNRMFEDLSKDRDLYTRFIQGLNAIIPGEDARPRFLTWIKGYLYSTMKDSCKMEILSENEDVKVRFIPTSLSEDGQLPVDNILQLIQVIVGEHEDDVEIYVALNNDDMTDNYVLMNILDIIGTMHEDGITVRNTFTTTEATNSIAGEIRDDTLGYGITELAAATRAFLKYGKVDMLVEYWNRSGSRNELIERMIYAMRRIDIGISLCNIREMEEGIATLRELFAETDRMPDPDDYFSKLFMVLADGIRADYGKLMEGEETQFIDLVKWGYRKKFYQQTLTLIESRAPREFVNRGIYYYCNNEMLKEHVVMLLAEERAGMKPYEYWKMNDIDHFFIKTYIRKGNMRNGNEDPQRTYARHRLKGLDSTNNDMITAYTACENRDVVENVLYAYYHIGDIRNYTNHAEDREGEDTRLIVDEKDDSIRLVKITEAVEYFIKCFDEAAAMTKGKELDVVTITSDEVRAFAKRLERRD